MSHSNLRIAIRSVVAALAMLVLSATAVFAEDGNILEPQHGIPLVVINIDESEEAIAAAEANDDKHDYGTIAEMNESEKHSVRCVGTVEIKVPDDYDLPGSDTSWVEKSLKLDYIRGRGNSTWSDVSKRPYKFKLSNKADLFGMGKSKEWALMANYYDDSIRLYFNANGRPGITGMMTLCIYYQGYPAEGKKIMISEGGRIRMERGTGAGK